jgi:hypothetical protein
MRLSDDVRSKLRALGQSICSRARNFWRRHKPPCSHCVDVDAMFRIEMRGRLYYAAVNDTDPRALIAPQHLHCRHCTRGPISTIKQVCDYLCELEKYPK